jgi:C_GCAxxG_C_C family probable redox protein
MREKALQFYRKGCNCSQSILKAACIRFHAPISQQVLKMCSPVSTGFGTGCICCALIGAIMAFGLFFDEVTAKRLRIQLLDEFQQQYGSLNCATLSKNGMNESVCEKIIGDIADMLEDIISRCK